MRLAELAVLYALVGAGCAAAVLARARARRRVAGPLDALLVLAMWPLYGPFLLARLEEPASPSGAGAAAFRATLEEARRTPLGALLPAPATVERLARRLALATGKVAEADALLARSEFSEDRAVARAEELRGRGASARAARSAELRVQSIRRLRQLRQRFARELDEISELLTQLAAGAEVVVLAGAAGADADEAGALIDELVARVEGLDELLGEEPGPGPGPPPPPPPANLG